MLAGIFSMMIKWYFVPTVILSDNQTFVNLMHRLASLLLIANIFYCEAAAQDDRAVAEQFSKDSRIWFSQTGDGGLARWDALESTQDFGIVLEWNAKEVILVRPDSRNKVSFPGDNVVRIEPAWNEPLDKVWSLFRDRKYQEVLTQGAEAIKSKAPLWQRRVILSAMIESASASGKSGIAGNLFEYLAPLDPPNLLLASIPLPWTDELTEGDTGMQPRAEKWIVHDQEAVRLLGAGWLLSGSKRATAIKILEQIAKDSKNPTLSAYARIQLWRIVPPAEIISERLPKWMNERDKLLFPCQAGPTMLLAYRLAQTGQPILAAGEWMRVATLHSERYDLVPKAFAKAIQSLRDADRTEDADRVQSMLQRYERNNKDG